MTIPAIAYPPAGQPGRGMRARPALGSDAAFLAGGTELIPDYQRERETARHLIALDNIRELRGIAEARGVLRIGALTTIAEVAASPLGAARGFAGARGGRAAIGSPQIRSMATIGGNFCRAVPCADTPPAAIACGAARAARRRGRTEIAAGHVLHGRAKDGARAGRDAGRDHRAVAARAFRHELPAICAPARPSARGGVGRRARDARRRAGSRVHASRSAPWRRSRSSPARADGAARGRGAVRRAVRAGGRAVRRGRAADQRRARHRPTSGTNWSACWRGARCAKPLHARGGRSQ